MNNKQFKKPQKKNFSLEKKKRNKMWYLYTIEYYSAMRRNEILPFAHKWMELENIILSKVIQAQKTKYCMFSLICKL
jgi:hypothetical protein